MAPPQDPSRGTTLACEGRGWGTHFRRLDRHYSTLYSNPFTVYVTYVAQYNVNTLFTVDLELDPTLVSHEPAIKVLYYCMYYVLHLKYSIHTHTLLNLSLNVVNVRDKRIGDGVLRDVF